MPIRSSFNIQSKRLWAILREVFGPAAEDILRAVIALNLGLTHVSQLTQEDILLLICWIDGLGSGS